MTKLLITILACCLVVTLLLPGKAASDGREEWEKALRAGKQEGRVVLYTFPGQELVFQEFQKTFPEIKLVEVSVRGSERVTRIVSERRAGKYLADILIGGVGSAQSGLLKSGLLDPIKPALILPEVLDESKWWQGKHVYGDDENKYIFSFAGAPLYYFHYNTTLVNPQEFKSYWDFLNPKWKGKIVVAEPMTGGTQEPLVFMYHNKELGPEFVRRFLAEMDVGVSRDIRQLLDWVAQGKYAISALQNADRIRLWDAKKQGLPVNAFEADRFKEGGLIGSGGGNIALINRAPNANAAKVFINWFLSREGQSAYQKLAQGGEILSEPIFRKMTYRLMPASNRAPSIRSSMTSAIATSSLSGDLSPRFGRKSDVMKISVARLIVEFLKEARVPYLFGLSGHSIFPITDALYAEPDLRFIPVMHELSAAYMAAAYAKGTRSLGVCTASAGAGVTNLLTGIAYAFKESIPVIIIAADVSRRHAGKGASSWHEIPQREMFEPVTKLAVTLESAGVAVDTLRLALHEATTGRKGPVYVGIPRDVQEREVEAPGPGWLASGDSIVEPDKDSLDRAVEELQKAVAPIIIAGGGVYWSRAEAELRELAELLSIPFGTSPSHKGLISEDHPLALGVLGFGAFPFANPFCLESDLILALGVTFSEGLTLGFGDKVIPRGAKIVHVDSDPRELGKIYPAHLPIVGDAKAVLRGLIARLKRAGEQKKNLSRLDKLREEKNNWREKILNYADEGQERINQWHVYSAIRETLSEHEIVVGAGGTAELMRRFIAPSYAYHSGEMRAIGFGLSTAIGLSLAFPEQPVVCVTGDGSFMLECQELATAGALKLPISIIVVRNDAYGNMKRDQIRHHEGRVIGTNLYLPDLCTLAGSYNIEAERVAQPRALLPAIKRALAVRQPILLDVICPIEGI